MKNQIMIFFFYDTVFFVVVVFVDLRKMKGHIRGQTNHDLNKTAQQMPECDLVCVEVPATFK